MLIVWEQRKILLSLWNLWSWQSSSSSHHIMFFSIDKRTVHPDVQAPQDFQHVWEVLPCPRMCNWQSCEYNWRKHLDPFFSPPVFSSCSCMVCTRLRQELFYFFNQPVANAPHHVARKSASISQRRGSRGARHNLSRENSSRSSFNLTCYYMAVTLAVTCERPFIICHHCQTILPGPNSQYFGGRRH